MAVLRNPCEGHPFRHFRVGAVPFRWKHQTIADPVLLGWLGYAVATTPEGALVFTRFLYGLRCLGTGSPLTKHLPNRCRRVRIRVNPASLIPRKRAASGCVAVAKIAPIA